MLSKESSRPTASKCLKHPWFSAETVTKGTIPAATVSRLKQFSHIANLKKAILMFIAYRCNNREEILKSRKIFLQIDSRKQGFVSYSDIHEMLEEHLDDESIKQIFESIDVDKNGKIFWNEFLAATISQSIYLKDDNLKEAFNNFDHDRDGYFDLENLKDALSDPSLKMSNQDFELIFKEAFPNGKTKINFDDFKQMMEHLQH